MVGAFDPPRAFDPEQLDLIEQTYEAVYAELAARDLAKGEERKQGSPVARCSRLRIP
jgi:hypothetical protein